MPQLSQDLPTYEDLPATAGAPPHSSWGLWGESDRFGCLNLLSAERTAAAARGVTEGLVIPLNASLHLFDTPMFERPPYEHQIVDRGLVRDDVLSQFNTQCSSQWDGFKHAQSRAYGFYNGLPVEAHSISAWAEQGIAGRGVLLDLEGYRSRHGQPLRYDAPDPISVDDLVGAAAEQRVTIETGDILLVHTGWLDWARENPPDTADAGFSTPGLRPGRETLARLWDWHVAAVASDTPSVEVWPGGVFASKEQRHAARTDPAALREVFMHADLLALLGLPLGEMWDTGRLTLACRRLERWTFLLTASPLNLPGGAASPSNAMALL